MRVTRAVKKMRTFGLFLWIYWCFVVSLDAKETLDKNVFRPPSVCGPRGVQMVAEHYGQEAELVELVKEMQNGIPEQGCSLQAIQDALDKRGVHCLVVTIGFLDFPQPAHPMVLHYKHGHFVVLEGTKGGYAQIRDGVDGSPRWEFIPSVMLQQSGAVLLTSDRPIQIGDLTLLWWPRLCAAVSCVALGGIGLFIRRRCLRQSLVNFKKQETFP